MKINGNFRDECNIWNKKYLMELIADKTAEEKISELEYVGIATVQNETQWKDKKMSRAPVSCWIESCSLK